MDLSTRITAEQAARLIDVSAVRTQNTLRDIEDVVGWAKKYRFINVHALPAWVPALVEMLKGVDGVYVGAPVGFPSGGHKTAVKLFEAEQLIEDGVEEMDIVMNVGKFIDGEYPYVQNELEKVISLARQARRAILAKVIIELNALTDAQAADACKLVIATGADFVKTGTGWIPGGANVDRIGLLKQVCGTAIKIKAAGGIRTPGEFLRLVALGVERMGINTASAVKIIDHLGAGRATEDFT